MGDSRGIGRAVTLGFAERGASVATCGHNQQALDAVREELADHGHPFYVAACDVGDAAAVETFVTAAAAVLGGLDVLVNCASALAPGNDAGAWSASVNVDLMGGVRALDSALPFLKRSGHASVINMASVAALKAVPARIAHGAMKAAVVHETASNALALATDGIRVRWSPFFGQVVKLGSPDEKDGPDDGQTGALYGRVQGEGGDGRVAG